MNSAGFTLTVEGTNFIETAIILWNGVSLDTTFTSATELSGSVPSDLLTSAEQVTITVEIPSVGISNEVLFFDHQSHAGANESDPTVPTGGRFGIYTAGKRNRICGELGNPMGSYPLDTTFISDTQLHADIPAVNISIAFIQP